MEHDIMSHSVLKPEIMERRGKYKGLLAHISYNTSKGGKKFRTTFVEGLVLLEESFQIPCISRRKPWY